MIMPFTRFPKAIAPLLVVLCAALGPGDGSRPLQEKRVGRTAVRPIRHFRA